MVNKKIKEAQKNGVPQMTPVQLFFAAAQERDIVGMMESIVDMDNNEFLDFSTGMSERLEKIFNSREYQNALATQLSALGDTDYERELAGYEGLMKTIDEFEDEDLSAEKKEFIKKLIGFSQSGILKYRDDPSEHIKVVFKRLNENATVPAYAHSGDAGADLYASEDCTACVGTVTFVHTGIALKIPKGYEGQIRPRSGMSAKTKIRVANAPGTIDSNYRGEIQILVDNYGDTPYIIHKGDRVAQIVFNKVPTADFEEGEVDTEEDNSRGEKGFGSSGTSELNG